MITALAVYAVLVGMAVCLSTSDGGVSGPENHEKAVTMNSARGRAAEDLLRDMVAYRDRVGPLGFQLEKFDDYLREARALIADG